MRLAVRIPTLFFTSLLLVSLVFVAFPQAGTFGFASAATLPVSGDTEYANGTITPPNSGLSLRVWYDWINTSDTQVISYAMYTLPDSPFAVPAISLIGQHLHLPDGTEVFVASALNGMEIYRDANGDGIPQANFTSGESEILYFMYTNTSDTYTMIPLEKTMQGNVTHYTWAFTYEGVRAFLQNTSTHMGIDARFKLDHLTLSYDFSVDGNVSNLKTNFDIGTPENVEVYDPAAPDGYSNSSQFSFQGLSLSLLYATATYTSKPYSVLVNGQSYNSTTAQSPATDTTLAQVTVDNSKAYDFVFGGNYTLTGNTNTVYPANVTTYEAKAEAAAIVSLPFKIIGPTVKGISFFQDQLNLTDLFGGNWPKINSNYESSSLVYRICFPVWDGEQIIHDPVYVGYLGSGGSETIPEFPAATVALVAALVGTVLVAAVCFQVRKKSSLRRL
jgi:hypothetical protein